MREINQKKAHEYLKSDRIQEDIAKKAKEKKKYLQDKQKEQKEESLSFQECYKVILEEGRETPKEIFQNLIKHISPDYDFEELISVGGESFVIAVQDSTLKRKLAVKIALPKITKERKKAVWIFSLGRGLTERETTEFKTRFLRGCKIQAQLHRLCEKGIIPDVLHINKKPLYLEMEFIEAYEFFEYLRKHDTKDNLSFFVRLLKFVNEIHEYFIIHRDLKPGNILISENGYPIILDFTTCKDLEDENLTSIGCRIGSPLFGSMVTLDDAGRANFIDDIYSLGIIFWCIIQKQFPEKLLRENLRDKKDRKAFLERHKKQLKEKFQDIFEKATNIEVDSRYQTLSSFIREVESELFCIQEKYYDTEINNIEEYTDYPDVVRQFIKTVRIIKEG